jgi:hypothetical protein
MTELASRKDISDALRAAIEKENLHTRGAAVCLNINPIYVSMCLNENSWDHLGKTAWARIEDWFYTKAPLLDYEIPEGEEIFVPAERYSGERKEKALKEAILPVKTDPEHTNKMVEKFNNTREREKKLISEIEKQIDKTVKIIDKKEPKTRQPVVKILDTKTDEKQVQKAPEFTDAVRLKVALDIEINLVVNGQRVHLY